MVYSFSHRMVSVWTGSGDRIRDKDTGGARIEIACLAKSNIVKERDG